VQGSQFLEEKSLKIIGLLQNAEYTLPIHTIDAAKLTENWGMPNEVVIVWRSYYVSQPVADLL
jgi:hypothetical protein